VVVVGVRDEGVIDVAIAVVVDDVEDRQRPAAFPARIDAGIEDHAGAVDLKIVTAGCDVVGFAERDKVHRVSA
jgi:hypothetical protein